MILRSGLLNDEFVSTLKNIQLFQTSQYIILMGLLPICNLHFFFWNLYCNMGSLILANPCD